MLLFSLTTASGATHYVWQDSPSPAPPYDSWTTAAHVIQDAVDAAQTGDTVLVAGGVYATGGCAVGTNQLLNRVAIDRAIAVESLMGPEVTIIQGYQVPVTTNGDSAIRCVYLADGASLSGFTLTSGATRTNGDSHVEQSGGGVWCESTKAVVSNCVVTGNSARGGGGGAANGTLIDCTLSRNSASEGGGAAGHPYTPCALNRCTLAGNSAKWGGGAANAALNNCTLTGNMAHILGGGARGGTLNHCMVTGNAARCGGGVDGSTLNNCLLAGNSAESGGGAHYCELNNCTVTGNSASEAGGGASGSAVFDVCYTYMKNCIVYFNTAPVGANVDHNWATLDYCCTTPVPNHGLGNITNAPLFLDYANGNLRLQSNSPCINAGNNAYVTSPTDLDGHPRIVSGILDIGAYEYQGPGP